MLDFSPKARSSDFCLHPPTPRRGLPDNDRKRTIAAGTRRMPQSLSKGYLIHRMVSFRVEQPPGASFER